MKYRDIYKNATPEQKARIDRLSDIQSTRFDEHSRAEQELDRWQREERRTFKRLDHAETALDVYMESIQKEAN